MNGNEAVTEPDRDFVGRIGRVFYPVSRIVDGVLYLRGDLMGLDPDIACGRTILPRPTPYIAEHPLVKLAQKGPVENFASPGVSPA